MHVTLLRLSDFVHALLAMEREPYAYEALLHTASPWILRLIASSRGRDLRDRACGALAAYEKYRTGELVVPRRIYVGCSPRSALTDVELNYRAGCGRFLAEWGGEFLYRLFYDEKIRSRAIASAAANLAAYSEEVSVAGPYADEWLKLAEGRGFVYREEGLLLKPFAARIATDILPACERPWR